jgi:hypothetical protein
MPVFQYLRNFSSCDGIGRRVNDGVLYFLAMRIIPTFGPKVPSFWVINQHLWHTAAHKGLITCTSTSMWLTNCSKSLPMSTSETRNAHTTGNLCTNNNSYVVEASMIASSFGDVTAIDLSA